MEQPDFGNLEEIQSQNTGEEFDPGDESFDGFRVGGELVIDGTRMVIEQVSARDQKLFLREDGDLAKEARWWSRKELLDKGI